MPRRIPSRDELTDDTPLRLEVAAELGWPGGGMTAGALRREIPKRRLPAELAAGKYWVTLAGIPAGAAFDAAISAYLMESMTTHAQVRCCYNIIPPD